MVQTLAAYRERALPRDLLALLLSGLVHVLPVVLGLIPALALRFLPKPPIEVEFLPPKPRPAPPAAAPLPSPPAPPAKPRTDPPRPGAGAAARRPPLSVQKMDLAKGRLSGLGPSAIDQDLGLRVLVRMPALRKSPHRATVEALLHAFPDTHILAAGTSLASAPQAAHPGSVGPSAVAAAGPEPGPMARALVDDVDALFIATADPRDITATVFYALIRSGAALPQLLAERRGPRWDTRMLHTLQTDLLAFARPDLLGSPTSPPPGAPPPEVPEAAAPLDPQWAGKLLAALRSPGPAVYAEVLNVRQRIRLRNGLPTPVSLRLAVSADADPEVHARIELMNADEAGQFLAALPGLQRDFSSRLFWLGLGSLLNGLKFQGRSTAVEITGRLPRGDTAVLLAWIRQLLPPPERFLDPPLPPPPLPDLGTAADLGGPDSGS